MLSPRVKLLGKAQDNGVCVCVCGGGGGWVQALEQCEESVTRSTKEFRAMDGGQVSVGSGPHLGHTRGSYWMVIG